MGESKVEPFGFEPTVFGAVRRHRVMVLVVALTTAVLAVGFTLSRPEVFRAQATITVPRSLSAQDQETAQYLASQVILLESPEVAERAARIANGSLGRRVLVPGDFKGEDSSLEIIPPVASTPGAYGSTLITVAFTWPDATVARVGTNALLQAFDDLRAAAITAQGEATVAGIERAIEDARTRGQLVDLLNQRTETLVQQEMDLATHPTFAWASEPRVPVNGNAKRSGAIGLLIGTVLGVALAFARSSRRRSFDDELRPAALYGAPLIGGVPTPATRVALSTAQPQLAMTAAPQSARAEAFRFAAGALLRIGSTREGGTSFAFVSPAPEATRSAVVANLALAVAESGTPVLAVDADPGHGDLTAWLLPDIPVNDGFSQVLAGERAATDCIEPSPLHEKVAVLGMGDPSVRVAGAAYATAARRVLAEARSSFEVVLVDGPPLLQLAVATELVDAAEAAVVVVGPGDRVEDHVDMQARLDRLDAELVGYVYGRGRRPPRPGHPRDLKSVGSLWFGRSARPSLRPAPPGLEPARSVDTDHGSPVR